MRRSQAKIWVAAVGFDPVAAVTEDVWMEIPRHARSDGSRSDGPEPGGVLTRTHAPCCFPCMLDHVLSCRVDIPCMVATETQALD